jgi:hypothetical protein
VRERAADPGDPVGLPAPRPELGRPRGRGASPRRCSAMGGSYGQNDEHPRNASGGVRRAKIRRRPTLPGGLPPSTIGAGGLNCRVRDGNGCDSAAMATGNLLSIAGSPTRTPERARALFIQALGRLVPVSSTRCRAYTSGLSTWWSRHGPYQVDPVGALILERASRLDAFSGYPVRR